MAEGMGGVGGLRGAMGGIKGLLNGSSNQR